MSSVTPAQKPIWRQRVGSTWPAWATRQNVRLPAGLFPAGMIDRLLDGKYIAFDFRSYPHGCRRFDTFPEAVAWFTDRTWQGLS